MENPFEKIIQNEKLPETLKQKVMDDIHLINLSLNMADLFAIKIPSAFGDMLDLNDPNKKKNK